MLDRDGILRGDFLKESAVITGFNNEYRYFLKREWKPEKRLIQFIGLNPSTADATTDDPTIRRCIGFAKLWGYGGFYMTNLFAYRATSPSDMKIAPDPIGSLNNDFILSTATLAANKTILCWGNHGSFRNRGQEVIELLQERDIPLWYVRRTKQNQPVHLLMEKYIHELELWD